jgi:S-DNA-T family DNA segregation ATPase FtsK/SpoIIIE
MTPSVDPSGDRPSIALPRPPERPDPPPFPVLATVAPVIGSVALWAITSSPFALLFALLGPVVAVASVGDAALSGRRRLRAERARFARDCERAEQNIASAHTAEIHHLDALAPGPGARVGQDGEHGDWTATVGAELPVTLGRGVVPSRLVLRRDGDDPAEPSELARLESLTELSRMIPNAPVVVDARWGIGVVGTPALTRSAARAVVMQIAASLSPAETVIGMRVDEREHGWLLALPHPSASAGSTDGAQTVRFRSRERGQPELVVSVAERAQDLPLHTRVVLRVGARSVMERHPPPAAPGELSPAFVSREELTLWAHRQRDRAVAGGLVPESGALPGRVTLGEIFALAGAASAGEHTGGPAPDGARGLSCVVGMGSDGVVAIDLAREGPHAIVGGTTGSGKSELLVSWVLAMASSRAPSDVTFLFVDFKGGAAFDPLRGLPHSVGVITDLDTTEVLRALESLRAEVRYRERVLAAAGLRSLAEAGSTLPVPRLVIVVDEYAALLEEHPQLQPVIVDLAARGRSLGIHLILCTQRPSGVVRDGILANCALRISLRVHDRADSLSLLGNDAAAQLPASPVGRAIVAVLGGETTLVQVATAAPADTVTVSRRWAAHPSPRRPWCPPLPAMVTRADMGEPPPGQRIAFGLVDLPREQRRDVAALDPARGSLLVVGAGGSGKTGVLRALAEAPGPVGVTVVAPSVPAVWDAVHAALSADGTPTVLLFDDVDAILAACPDDYTTALTDALYRLLREGPHRGVTAVLTVQRLTGGLHALAALCASTLILRTSSLQEHVVAGGSTDTWDPALPPGGGIWHTDRVQVVHAPELPVSHTAQVVDVALPDLPPVVVTTRPRQFAAAVRGQNRTVIEVGSSAEVGPFAGTAVVAGTGAHPPVTVGDPDAWMSRWGALAAAREEHSVLFDGCSTTEFRTLTGIRELPPPVARGERALWLLGRDGTARRARVVLDGQLWIP